MASSPTHDRWPSAAHAVSSVLRRSDLRLATPWEEPRSQAEVKLAEIWKHVLDMDAVGAADDFFDLGGDSFAATTLAAEIEAAFDIRFAPVDIINLSTIAQQARAVSPDPSQRTRQLPPHVIVGRAGGSQPPLFLVHGAAGFSFFKRTFLDEVGQDRPIYLFQAPGLDGRTRPLRTVEEIAGAYVSSMREIQPAGPYYIAGMCAGSFIALEMCNQLVEAGQSIARLILLDPQPTPRALATRYATTSKSRRPSFLQKGPAKRICDAVRHISRALPGASDPFAQELRQRAKTLKRQEAIRRRRLGEVDWASPDERSYSPEAMLDASLQLHEALKTHIPRPFSGKAAILSRSKRADRIVGGTSFWRDHLGGIDCRVYDSSHRELFGAKIVETARFVRSVFDSES